MTKIIEWIEKSALILNYIGMLALIVMIVFVNTDIVARYFFDRPIPGSPELISLLLVLVSFFSLALPQFRKRHITVTVIIDLLAPKVRNYIDATIALLSAGFTFFIIWATWEQAASDISSHAITSVMRLPVPPFKVASAVAAIFLFLAFMCDLVHSLQKIRKPTST